MGGGGGKWWIQLFLYILTIISLSGTWRYPGYLVMVPNFIIIVLQAVHHQKPTDISVYYGKIVLNGSYWFLLLVAIATEYRLYIFDDDTQPSVLVCSPSGNYNSCHLFLKLKKIMRICRLSIFIWISTLKFDLLGNEIRYNVIARTPLYHKCKTFGFAFYLVNPMYNVSLSINCTIYLCWYTR